MIYNFTNSSVCFWNVHPRCDLYHLMGTTKKVQIWSGPSFGQGMDSTEMQEDHFVSQDMAGESARSSAEPMCSSSNWTSWVRPCRPAMEGLANGKKLSECCGRRSKGVPGAKLRCCRILLVVFFYSFAQSFLAVANFQRLIFMPYLASVIVFSFSSCCGRKSFWAFNRLAW